MPSHRFAARAALYCGGLLLSLPLYLAAQVTGELPDLSDLDPNAACERLPGLSLAASAIALPTGGARIESAQLVSLSEGDSSAEYCRVRGAIQPLTYTAPDIRFQVNLPNDWNGKTLQFGGGALNGVLIEATGHYIKQPAAEASPLARGYVTLGSDSGHQSAGGFDGSFFLNEEALRNFGHEQVKKTHDVAQALVRARYGRAPDYDYFIGGSQGGHEAFDAVQRYPDDYDGVVAGYPAHNMVMLHLAALNYARALHAEEGAAWLSPAETEALRQAVYSACDGLDGAEDGIIANVSACREATRALARSDNDNPLRCRGGQDRGDDCLADAQLGALRAMDRPYELGFRLFRDDADSAVFPKWTPFEGSTFMDGGFPNLGAEGPAQALQLGAGDATVRYAIVQDLDYDSLADFEPRQWAGRISTLVPLLSANSVELERFHARGGKVIMFHGLIDDFITPYSSIQYYERLVSQMGEDTVRDFFRFYTVPGMGHVTGPFDARLSTLDALERWVEQGEAPEQLVAVDANPRTAGRSRPVCHYPAWPRYGGSGDINDAANFECVSRDSE